jgi:hypothetical protein
MVKLGYFIDFRVKQLSEEIFSTEAIFFGVFVKEAANFLAHEGDFTVDKLFDFDKCIFDLQHKRSSLFIFFVLNLVFFIELKIFLLELSKLVIKIFVKEEGRDLVMVFSLFFHMELAVVNDFPDELNEPLDSQQELLIVRKGFVGHFQIFQLITLGLRIADFELVLR